MRTTRLSRTALSLGALVALGGCGDDLDEGLLPEDAGTPVVDSATPPGEDAATPPPSERVRHTPVEGGTETFVDASSMERWVLLDLDAAGAEVDAAIDEDTTWDLALQRYHFRTNGGAGGPAGVRVAVLDGVGLDEVTQAPSEGWRQDAPPMDSEIPGEVTGDGEVPSTVISNDEDPWYEYDGATHSLTPKTRVYVIESTERAYFALEVVDYYDPATAEAGYPAFRWKEVDAPEAPPAPGIEVDASDREAWVHLTLAGETVDEGGAWDLALRRTAIRTRSGASAEGFGGAKELVDASWESLEATSTVGFAVDTLLPLPGPPGSGEAPGNEPLSGWYDYDPSTHAVSPRDAIYAIRGGDGSYAKLRIHGWEDGVYRLELEPIAGVVDRREDVVDASASGEWAHFSFRAGALVETEAPAEDGAWDIAFSRTLVRTNSGASGAGEGGAAEAETSDLDAIDAAAESYAADEEVALPGPPGSGTTPANPVLNGWYAYDPSTHTVSPRDAAYLVRTADGGHVKLRVLAWEDGVYTLDWAYAGAGRDSFGGE
ncbi:MAG TPA: HmuY family protein [Polyangiaceae bacterium LLY-WYZ-15_(1-7)]|nr:HmuY family protein [Polyangiaceae bacterium LLY-WYZ-15_(1-7)]HJL00791.1 HmuY family protein [Polyangiaceae bacterium LLY-WYZ-15_(1-7)]HJL13561.1 HmuY family protein [Polyangiaceae bacterium LLY-WYZ-15_(1-7)]HJL27587.1 HmuY family protein [Polyangiaceae bacterium LLY-WYZ-15_(1-7)]HJL34966.1 HmuY family protein [Polyangiaceae bacterium LLY-WYZ-15_(1-7)]